MVQRFHAAQSNKCPEFGPPDPAWEVVGKEIFSKKMSNLGKRTLCSFGYSLPKLFLP
jgi:hypothetical protein